MKLIKENLNEYATLTGFLHEPADEMGNISAFPVMLVLPGGGFRFCSEREGEPVAMAFYAQGYSAFVLDYTTITKKANATIQDPMNDTVQALKWIRSHAQELHMLPDRLAMAGFSGGGHLAAAVATHCAEKPNALVLGYPGIIHSDLRALDCPDIVESVTADTPPSFIFSTRNDQVTPPVHPLSFAQALQKAGVAFELHIFREGVHGLSLATSLVCSGDRQNVNPVVSEWFPMCIRWLFETLGDFTIYGVNDGRCGRFSIDTVLRELFEDKKAAALTRSYVPMADQLAESPQAGFASLRQIQKFVPGISKETLAQLDEELLKL